MMIHALPPNRLSPLTVAGWLIFVGAITIVSASVQAAPGECTPHAALVSDAGVTAGAWSDPGVVDNATFDCSGGPCTFTGEIDVWNCADPDFRYAGPNTGFEYTYTFTAPGAGTCTFIEYDEGVEVMGTPQPVVDWFILSAGGGAACAPANCIDWVWENVNNPLCVGGGAVCSFKEFAVEQGQEFFIVADIYSGLQQDPAEMFPREENWDVEVICDVTVAEPVPAMNGWGYAATVVGLLLIASRHHWRTRAIHADRA